MTDVRLTATNPEDSSVVPVACNARGELLIDEPTIEQIDNNLTINGNFYVRPQPEGEEGAGKWYVTKSGLTHYLDGVESPTQRLYHTGYAIHERAEDTLGAVYLCGAGKALQVNGANGSPIWSVSWTGSSIFRSVQIPLEPDNPDHYAVAEASQGDGEEALSTYSGPVLDVAEELAFLRAQVKALMEKLKMTPEGGWEVWDGSD